MEYAQEGTVDRTDIVRKVTRRLIPFVGIAYLIAYIDRQNVSFAKLQMVGDLGLSEYAYGLGASLFFIGYFLFEVPSNMLLERIGARKTLLRIMVCWGVVAAAMAFVQTPTQFYIARFLLGALRTMPGQRYHFHPQPPQPFHVRRPDEPGSDHSGS